jgi:RNA polymerase sigma-70 factor (ECF subfamily)
MVPEQAIRRVRKAFEDCRTRYPTISLPFELFLSRAIEVLRPVDGEEHPGDQAWELWLTDFDRLPHADLFLALACSRGDRIAWEYFVDDYLSAIQGLAARACKNLEEGEDLAQELIAGMLGDGAGMGSAAGPRLAGKLTGYSGRGSLLGWLRVVVSHAAIDRIRRRRKEASLDEMLDEGLAAPADDNGRGPTSSLDAHWGPLLTKILTEEIRRLPARDRLLLALYYVQIVPLKLIGLHFGVHEATASRWLDQVRKGIRRSVERECRKKHGLKAQDVEQLWQWMSRDGELSLPELLGISQKAAKAAADKLQDPSV